MARINHHVVLSSRPGANNEPSESNFRFETCPTVGPSDVQAGELLIKSLCLSTDPAQRCQMNEDTGADYLPSWQLDETITGLSGVGQVLASNHPDYKAGDIVSGMFPWKAYFLFEDSPMLKKLDFPIFKEQPSLGLSVMGIPGLTAIIGIWEKGHVRKGGGQTMVVSGAAGATGSLAGQIAKIEGIQRVIGICGSDEKCSWLTSELHFDAAVNYKTDDVSERLRALCPEGVHVYFDNVGGCISDIVIQQMAQDSHVVLCGQIAVYNKDVPCPPSLPTATDTAIKDKNITRDRFLVLNYPGRLEEAARQLLTWYMEGKLKVRETVENGLENAGKAFVSMMKGGNIGKQIVHVADPET